MLAEFAHVDQNTVLPEAPVHQGDGGLMDEDELLAFLDEVEGEFGVELHQPQQEAIATMEDLVDFLSALIEEKMAADADMV